MTLPPRRTLALASMFMLFAGALAAGAALVWAAASANEPSRHGPSRAALASLAVALLGVAGKRLSWDVLRTRHPRWNRASAALTVLWAAYMLFLAVRGW